MKAGTIAVVALCIAVAAGTGIYFYNRKKKGVTGGATSIGKNVTKDDIVALLSDSEKESVKLILDQMSQQELNDCYLIMDTGLKAEKGQLKMEDVFKNNPGLQDRMEALSKKYNIFT